MRASALNIFTVMAAAATVVLAATECRAYDPLPWDRLEGDTIAEPEITPAPRRRSRRRHRGGRVDMFGSVGAAFDWTGHLAGDVQGTGGGAGYSLTIPATLPGWLVYSIIDARAVFATMTAEAWTSGFHGGGLGTAPVIDEVSFDFIYSVGSHEDLVSGGDLTLTRYGIGIHATGPGPEERRIRGGLSVGWCWHDFDFDNRADMTASGPYVGAGFEFRFEIPSSENVMGVRLDARWDLVHGLDGSGGAFDAELFTSSVGFRFMW